MALNQNTKTVAAAAFEAEDVTMVDQTAETPADTSAPAKVEKASTEVAVAATKAIAVARTGAAAVMSKNVLSGLKDAFHVDFDSLPSVGASQGSFNFKDTEQELGSEVQIQLMSYQSSWVASPNDTKADIELVKYSEDGVTSKDGTNLLAHVEDLKEQGYHKAKIAHRVVLVGELLTTKVEGVERVGELVMVGLPDSGRRAFNTFTLQASYSVAKGRKTAEEASILTLKAVKDKTKGGEIYTRVAIS